MGDDAGLYRPCWDCGRRTGSWCDGGTATGRCSAVAVCPAEQWEQGQATPLTAAATHTLKKLNVERGGAPHRAVGNSGHWIVWRDPTRHSVQSVQYYTTGTHCMPDHWEHYALLIWRVTGHKGLMPCDNIMGDL